jgi:hypothetical protein
MFAIEDGDLAIMVRGDVRSRLHRQHRKGFANIGIGSPDASNTEPRLALLREQPFVLALLLRVLGVRELVKAVRDNETTPAGERAAF